MIAMLVALMTQSVPAPARHYNGFSCLAFLDGLDARIVMPLLDDGTPEPASLSLYSADLNYELDVTWRLSVPLRPGLGETTDLWLAMPISEPPGDRSFELVLLLDDREAGRTIQRAAGWFTLGPQRDSRIRFHLEPPTRIPNLAGHSRLDLVARLPGGPIVGQTRIRLPNWRSIARKAGRALREAERERADFQHLCSVPPPSV